MKLGVFPFRLATIAAVVALLLLRELSSRFGIPWLLWIGVAIAMVVMLIDGFVWISRDIDK